MLYWVGDWINIKKFPRLAEYSQKLLLSKIYLGLTVESLFLISVQITHLFLDSDLFYFNIVITESDLQQVGQVLLLQLHTVSLLRS